MAKRQMNRTVDTSQPTKTKRPRSSRPSKTLRQLLAEREPKDLVDVVDEMLSDYQIALAFRSMKAIIKSAQVTIAVEDADSLDPATRERAKKVADLCHNLFKDRWSTMLDCIPYGRVAFEKVWEIDRKTGCYYLSDLDPLPFRETEMLITTKEHEDGAGRFCGIRLSIKDQDPLDLGADKSWWLALDPDATNPYGKSRFMGAPHKVYQKRKLQFEREENFEDKLLFPGSISHVPDDPIIEGGQSYDPKEAFMGAMDDYRAGGNVLLSNERHTPSGEYLWDVNIPQGASDASPIINLIAMTDVHVLRAFGILEKTVIEGAEVGSYAMVSLQMVIVRAMCDEIFDQIKKSFQKYVLDKVSAVNGLPSLSINAPNLAQIPDSLLLEIVQGILTSPQLSPLIASGAVDIFGLLESAGVPLSDNAKGVIAELVAKLKAMPLAAPPSGPPGGTFANPQEPGEGAELLAGLPTLDELIESANAEAASLWDDLLDVLARLHATGGHESPYRAEALLRQLQELQADTMTAGRLLGMCSVWRPELSSPPKGSRNIQKPLSPNPIRMANGQPILMSLDGIDADFGGSASIIRYPFLNDALAWLREKQIATADQVKAMAAIDKSSVFTAADVNSLPTLIDLRNEVARSLETGESLYNFRKRLGDQLTGTRAQQETLYRTNTKQAYNAGMEKTLDDPDVGTAFDHVYYAATLDNRTRSSHWMLDGFVCSRKDPAYAVLQRAVNDWNCRCAIIPMNRRQAEAKGIKTYADLPAEVLARYA